MSAPLHLECQHCGAALVVEATMRTAKCPYCASPTVVERPPSPDRPVPTFALGFVVTPERALRIARDWVKKPFFAPSAFRRTVPSEIRGLYVPAYLYSAEVSSTFSAQIGEDYTVTETYTTTDSKGNTQTHTRTRVETEWRALGGSHATYVTDRVVTASRGLPNAELEAIEPFDLRALHRYSPKIISGWATEEPSMPVQECVQLARGETMGEVGLQLAQFLPGDRQSGLTHQSRMDNEHMSLTLVPVWVLPVRYADDEPVVRLLVNGQTGKLHGRAPTSWVKITIAVLLVLAPLVAAALYYFLVRRG
ncbi:MAG: hypothetical protein AB7S26_03170 [Sandaracinaceae bacterium]